MQSPVTYAAIQLDGEWIDVSEHLRRPDDANASSTADEAPQ